MIVLTPEEAGAALGLSPLSAPVTGVSIDSRSIAAGDLFVALRGERFDGHEFVGAVAARGASGLVVEQDRAGDARKSLAGSSVPVYEVADTLEALWALARAVRRNSAATVFGVTGSVGKTSTKDLLHAMLRRVRRVVSTSGNQNNEVGVALTLFNLQPDTEAVVVEMAMRGRGQIAQLAAVAEPDVGLITNIHPVHLELLGSLEGIAEAKAELLAGLRAGGVAVVPHGCALLLPFVARCACRVVTFAAGASAPGADVTGGLEAEHGAAGRVFRLRWPGSEARLETRFMWSHTVENAVAAAAACYAAGLPVEECLEGINETEFSKGRGQVIELPGLWVIDDTYNANPAAMRAALDNLVGFAREKAARPVAVLGDMLELGLRSAAFHREIGGYAAERGVQMLWGVGELSRHTVAGFEESLRTSGGDGQATAGHVRSAEEIGPVLAALRRGDAVLFKASRSIGLDGMVRRVAVEAGSLVEEKR